MSSTGGSPDLPSRLSTAQATPTPPITNEAQNIPIQMAPTIPHLFANPFMSPFMPQQTMDANGAPLQAPIGNGAQFPQQGMFFSPAQYQEMMQQYFQQMMLASQQYAGQMAFPMPFQQFSHPATRPESQASMNDSLAEATNGIRNVYINDTPSHHEIPTATVAPIVPQSSLSISSEEEKSPEKNASQHIEDSCATDLAEKIIDDGATPSTATENDGLKLEDGDGSGSEDRKSSIPKDEKTSSLIKKQMSEIEKEIIRRSQNKNIKQMDDRELADLMGPSAADLESEFGPAISSADYQQQMGLPYTPPVTEAKPAPKETLNQLRNSFNLPENGPTTAAPATFTNIQVSVQQPQMSVGFPGLGAVPSMVAPIPSQMGPHFINPFAQAQPYSQYPAAIQSTQQFTPEQIAAAFLANNNIGQMSPQQFAAAPTAMSQPQPTVNHDFHAGPSGGHTGLAPPPAPSHPVNRSKPNQNAVTHMPVIGQSSSSDWPDENKENGDEPVWVLRESYLKRMQRDNNNAVNEQQDPEWGVETSAVPELGAEEEEETDRLIATDSNHQQHQQAKKKNSKETMVHEPAVLIEGVLFRARYLGSTQMICETRSSKAARMNQAQEAVARVKAPQGEIQPSTEIDLFISTEKIMVLNTDLQRISDTDVRQDILMDHALRTISYIADIGDLVVLMARRMTASDSEDSCDRIDGVKRAPKVICHVFESDEASFIAQSIGQAFQVAYVEFLRANGIDDPSYLRQIDYQEVLNSQELLGDELEMFARKETQKDVVVPKKSGESLGIVVVESGWGSMLPTVVLAHMNTNGPAARSNQLNIGDQIININGISLVGLPLSAAQNNIKNVKTATAVRLTVVSTPPVVEVRIRRPDTKYQLGFSVQNGVICSLLRGGIAERGGIRVGHRIIEINGHSVVAVAHDRIVNMLATAIGEIHMKTMPTSMFRLLTGQEIPQYI